MDTYRFMYSKDDIGIICSYMNVSVLVYYTYTTYYTDFVPHNLTMMMKNLIF